MCTDAGSLPLSISTWPDCRAHCPPSLSFALIFFLVFHRPDSPARSVRSFNPRVCDDTTLACCPPSAQRNEAMPQCRHRNEVSCRQKRERVQRGVPEVVRQKMRVYSSLKSGDKRDRSAISHSPIDVRSRPPSTRPTDPKIFVCSFVFPLPPAPPLIYLRRFISRRRSNKWYSSSIFPPSLFPPTATHQLDISIPGENRS